MRFFSRRTHAVETPGVFELVFAPCLSEDIGFLFAEMAGEFVCDGLCGEKSAIGIECYDLFLLWVGRIV